MGLLCLIGNGSLELGADIVKRLRFCEENSELSHLRVKAI